MTTITDTTPRTIRVEHTEDGRWLVHVNGYAVQYPNRADARTAARAYRNGEAPPVWPVDGPAELTPEVNTTTDPELAELPYRELAELARTEHKALKDARRAGAPLPPTPHLDALNERYEAGERAATSKRKRPTSTPRATSVLGKVYGVVDLTVAAPELIGTTPEGFAAHPDAAGVLRIHRAGCTRMPKSAEPLTSPLPEQVSIPTCCKPRFTR